MVAWNLQQFAGEKTERATPQRRREARQRGQTPKSNDLTSSFVLFIAMLVLYGSAGSIFQGFEATMQQFLTFGKPEPFTQFSVGHTIMEAVWSGGQLIMPIAAAVIGSAIVLSFLQTGVVFSFKPIIPDFSRINPLEGAKRLASARSLVELAKSIVKLLITGATAYSAVSSIQGQLINLTALDPPQMVQYMAQTAFGIAIRVAVMLVVLAIMDLLYQRYEFEKSIRMSKQEIKDEFKRAEGNPLIKRRMRERQRQMAMARMMQDVPKADVIITNPTHYAVALRYDNAKMDAPEIIAKGMDELALRIKQVAREHDIVLVENRPLAQTLYKAADIGERIPAELYQAVAEVLAYVYRLKRRV